MTNIKELYLKKIKNDIDEKIYDLLVLHLKEVHKIIPKNEENKEYIKGLKVLLYQVLEDLKKINKYNYLQNYRYSILIINTLLSYKPDKKILKKLKLKILNKFTSEDIYDIKEKIPLRSQMTEVRITYNVDYLIYLLEKQFIPKKIWDKAMYCLIAIELIEPDNELILKYKSIIENNLIKKNLQYKENEEPKDYIILLDTNIILSKVLYDVGNYKIKHNNLEEYTKLMEKWGNKNKFIISKSVKQELEKQIKYSFEIINDVCNKYKKFNRKEIINTIEKRFNNLINKYYIDNLDYSYDLKEIENFYFNYIGNLYELTLEKINQAMSEDYLNV